jgi:hypothetical protein
MKEQLKGAVNGGFDRMHGISTVEVGGATYRVYDQARFSLPDNVLIVPEGKKLSRLRKAVVGNGYFERPVAKLTIAEGNQTKIFGFNSVPQVDYPHLETKTIKSDGTFNTEVVRLEESRKNASAALRSVRKILEVSDRNYRENETGHKKVIGVLDKILEGVGRGRK